MKKLKNIKINKDNYIYFYLAFYVSISLLFLTSFPRMHSDESWLSGLTRTMMSQGLNTTEYFFDALPRYPHAIKSIFHILQMPFILVFGYNLFAVRLMSLVFATIALFFFYKLLKHITKSSVIALIGTIILSIDIQFVYSSHFARQESIIVAFLIFGIYYVVLRSDNWSIKNDIVMAIIIGLSIGIHPNSFIVALTMGAVYIYYLLFDKKLKLKNLVVLILVTLVFALIFIGLSFLMDNNFISNYTKYGDTLRATSKGIMKLLFFPDYYRKLFNGFSVTYYTPLIKVQLIIFALSMVVGTIGAIFSNNLRSSLLFVLPIFAVNVGYVIIGRYSQPGIVLLFPLGYLLIFTLLNRIKKFKVMSMVLIGIIIIINTTLAIVPALNNDYNSYIKEIEKNIPKDAKVLANLNTEYAFEYNQIYDYRNLAYLEDAEFEKYIDERDIEYIIFPEEMDFIYENRPVWNVLYGNVFPYYDDIQVFFDTRCQLIDEFSSPYAMRILMYADDKDWSVKIYKVMEADND